MFAGRLRYSASSSEIIQMTKNTLAMPSQPLTSRVSTSALNQASLEHLPKLPVPQLKQTMTRFLAVAKPIVSADEFKQTKLMVDEFSKNEGPQLQELLLKRAQARENWLSDWWLDIAYLEQRVPVVINVSPGLCFPLQRYSGRDGQIDFASKLISGLLQFKQLIDKDKLRPDISGTSPLDMTQYNNLFGTCRIPGEMRDTLSFNPDSRHITVAYKSNFFHLSVYKSNGEALQMSQIKFKLNELVGSTENDEMAPQPFGLLTSRDRSSWAKCYSNMIKEEENMKNLKLIETSLFLVAIDEQVNSTDSELNSVAQQCLHGGGVLQNSANRYFDKTLQFVVGFNGGCGITYEHSPAEGPPVAALMDFVMEFMENNPDSISPTSVTQEPRIAGPRKLEFKLGSDELEHVECAKRDIDNVAGDVEIASFRFQDYGKNVPKSAKLSPDSYIQLAFQLAYNKLHNRSPPTYETGTLRRFLHGRTDTIRLPLVESDAFVAVMRDGAASQTKRYDALRKAVQAHREYTFAACSGNGIDRHLLGLKLIALENGRSVPKLLLGEAYNRAVHFQLSTSQVGSKYDSAMVFGPMYPDCYGVCYNPRETSINAYVTAYNSFPETSANAFAEKLAESFREMGNVLAESQNAKI